MGKRIYLLYLNNYRGIHHIISLVIFVTLLLFAGLSDLLRLLPFQIFVLVCNYFITNFSLNFLKMHKTIEQEIKELEKEDNKH